MPQVAYYVYGYVKLMEEGAIQPGEPVNVVVPTGNFGNILAAYFAMKMGIPVHKFICASNENKVLTDFINTGVYDTHRDFYSTNSPSMDILISSNLERLLYLLSGRDGQVIRRWMEELEQKKVYTVSDTVQEALKDFYGGFCTEQETLDTIGEMYREHRYLMDTHTAVAYKVYRDYVKMSGDQTPTLIASTASAYKFAEAVSEAIGLEQGEDGFAAMRKLEEETGVRIPAGLRDLDKKPVLHKGVCETEQMAEVVLRSLR